MLAAILAMRGMRWAYVVLVALALAYFPEKGGFSFESPSCSAGPSGDLFVTSVTNYSHIVLFALFFVITYVHFARGRMSVRGVLALATGVTLIMSVLIEILQGATGTGNCELRDLIPDGIGVLVAMAVIALWIQVRRVWARLGLPRREADR